jgi:hypothetical protein
MRYRFAAVSDQPALLKSSAQNFYREDAKEGKGKEEAVENVILKQPVNHRPDQPLPCLSVFASSR